jgi:glycosyltransferase involved in cell wall biosynthesis
MSYELPVVTTDLWANAEMVADGKTGFVIKKSAMIQYYVGNFIPNWSHYPISKFMNTIKKTIDPLVVKGLVEKTSVLIEDKELRRNMGRSARYEVENGKFSLVERNKKLAQIFSEAMES